MRKLHNKSALLKRKILPVNILKSEKIFSASVLPTAKMVKLFPHCSPKNLFDIWKIASLFDFLNCEVVLSRKLLQKVDNCSILKVSFLSKKPTNFVSFLRL